MNRLILIALLLASGGCRTVMKASATCAFKAESADRNYRYIRSVIPPDSACQFTIEAPIKKSAHAKEFAEAFTMMLGASPDNGAKPTEVKLETKGADK